LATAGAKKVIVAAGAAIGAAAGSAALQGKGTKATLEKIDEVFPGSLANKELVSRVFDKLSKYGYGKSSIVATSLCADEVNRVLETDFSLVYNANFHMGGLAGFPFGGITAFGAMAAHIPDGGSCLVVFGPHVGVDSKGAVGTTERRGREAGGACCGSAVAASGYVSSVFKKETEKAGPPQVAKDAQQVYVGNMLLPYAERLEKADDKMVELPYALYDAQKEMITKIVMAACGAVEGDGKIAVLGGIQVNTPPGETDYYLPLSFELYSNTGDKMEDLTL
jgi:hypothetical protein